jgi:hypothetical protein
MLIGIGGIAITKPGQSVSLWTPTQLSSSLALWLDASDSGTITLNGSTVSQWSDKSGNGKHAVQATSNKQPAYNSSLLNNLGGLVYDGSDDCLQVPSLGLRPFISVFIVLKQLDTGKPFFIEHGINANSNDGFYFYGQNLLAALVNRSSVISQGEAAPNWPGTTNEVFSLVFRSAPPSAGQSPIIFKSGNTVSLFYGTATTPADTSSTLTLNIGARNNGAVAPMNANLHELVVCNTDLNTLNRQKMEGYLAWKWGLQGNLPAGHPYKSAPPTI